MLAYTCAICLGSFRDSFFSCVRCTHGCHASDSLVVILLPLLSPPPPSTPPPLCFPQEELPTYRELRKEVTAQLGDPFSSKDWRKWFRMEVDAMFTMLDEAEASTELAPDI